MIYEVCHLLHKGAFEFLTWINKIIQLLVKKRITDEG
jgi:hypothetical protein